MWHSFQVKGAIVLLSDQGELNCCYLGTKPTLFVAPPLENSITNFKNVGRKLEKLQEHIKEFNATNGTDFCCQFLQKIMLTCLIENLYFQRKV